MKFKKWKKAGLLYCFVHQCMHFFLYCLSVFFLFTAIIKADIGKPAFLLDEFFQKNYEPSLNGKDSHVLMVHGVEHFNKEVLEAPHFVIVHCFSKDQDKKSFFQKIAHEYKNNYKCISLNLIKNDDVAQQLMYILSNMILHNKNIMLGAPSLYKYIGSLITSLNSLVNNQEQSLSSFFLFFHKGILLLMEENSCNSKEELETLIAKYHMLALKNDTKKDELPSLKSEQPASFINTLKSFFKK